MEIKVIYTANYVESPSAVETTIVNPSGSAQSWRYRFAACQKEGGVDGLESGFGLLVETYAPGVNGADGVWALERLLVFRACADEDEYGAWMDENVACIAIDGNDIWRCSTYDEQPLVAPVTGASALCAAIPDEPAADSIPTLGVADKIAAVTTARTTFTPAASLKRRMTKALKLAPVTHESLTLDRFSGVLVYVYRDVKETGNARTVVSIDLSQTTVTPVEDGAVLEFKGDVRKHRYSDYLNDALQPMAVSERVGGVRIPCYFEPDFASALNSYLVAYFGLAK